MGTMTTTGKNKLIAEFRGYKTNGNNFMVFEGIEGQYYEDKLYFHSSWDWLMPVIRKIKELDWTDDGKIGVIYVDIFNSLDDINIEAAHESVTDFIKYYNEQKFLR